VIRPALLLAALALTAPRACLAQSWEAPRVVRDADPTPLLAARELGAPRGYRPGPAFVRDARALLAALPPPAGWRWEDTVDVVPETRSVAALWWRPEPVADGTETLRPVPLSVRYLASDTDLTLLARLEDAALHLFAETP
jgi:hypothetical protein